MAARVEWEIAMYRPGDPGTKKASYYAQVAIDLGYHRDQPDTLAAVQREYVARIGEAHHIVL